MCGKSVIRRILNTMICNCRLASNIEYFTGLYDLTRCMLRALFDYDPTTDVGLPGRGLEFRYGHILNVVGDEDSDWWHAVRIMPDDGASGVIPSKHRYFVSVVHK